MMSDTVSRIVTIVVFLALLTSAVPIGMASELSQPAVLESLSWQLSGARVVNTGETSEIGEGTIINGYAVESDATIQRGSGLVTNGKFKMMATVFSPRKDRPGQQAGRWYLRGNWSITCQSVIRSHSIPTVFKGDLAADLPFNPAIAPGSVEAQINMSKMPVRKRWGSGKGTFSGNERFEGVLTLALNPAR